MLFVLNALSEARRGLDDTIWKLRAYVGRYGHQTSFDLREMTVVDLTRWSNELSRIVGDEKPER